MRLRAARHKYGAKKTKRNDISFPSKLEAETYSLLKSLQNSGKILFFLRQVSVDLEGGARHVIDFMAFTDTEAYFIESKGRDLPMSVLKRRQAEERLGVEIHVVHKPEEILAVLFSKCQKSQANTDCDPSETQDLQKLYGLALRDHPSITGA